MYTTRRARAQLEQKFSWTQKSVEQLARVESDALTSKFDTFGDTERVVSFFAGRLSSSAARQAELLEEGSVAICEFAECANLPIEELIAIVRPHFESVTRSILNGFSIPQLPAEQQRLLAACRSSFEQRLQEKLQEIEIDCAEILQRHRAKNMRNSSDGSATINNIYGGNTIIASHAENISQIAHTVINQGDTQALIEALQQLGITKEGLKQLESYIEADKVDGKPSLGERVKGWMAKAGTYVGKEGAKAGVEVAKKMATKWILQHYGIDV